MRVNEYPSLLVAGDMTGDLSSAAMPVSQAITAAVQASWTGSPVGTFHILVSNDGIIYSVLTDSDLAVTTAGNYLWNITLIGFNWIKLRYTHTSGTGTLDVTSSYKG